MLQPLPKPRPSSRHNTPTTDVQAAIDDARRAGLLLSLSGGRVVAALPVPPPAGAATGADVDALARLSVVGWSAIASALAREHSS